MEHLLEINGVGFTPIPGVRYRHNYEKVVKLVAGTEYEAGTYADVLIRDLWFIVYFVLKVPNANHPFVVQACKDVEKGPETDTLDIWSRGHFKSTIITIAETIQYAVKFPNHSQGIFSYKRGAAMSILRSIKSVFETSVLLKACFPDVCYDDPRTQAWKWSEDDGLYLKRTSTQKEATIEAHGLIEGMPTGKHFNRMVFDDIMTDDMADSPEMIWKVKEKYDQAMNLGMHGSPWVHRSVGTPYHHEDVIQYIRDKKDPVSGQNIYHVRLKPATEDGTWGGKPVLMTESEIAKARANPRKFSAQQLLNPTPGDLLKLDYRLIKTVEQGELPKNLFKFMVVDPAGMRKSDKRAGDSWALCVFGIEPHRDDIGASNFYILDLFIEPCTEYLAMKSVVEMYDRNGRILKLGVEKVGISTMEIHIAQALRAKGRVVSIESGTLVPLSPGGRSKEKRIEQNLVWALNNGKVHMLDTVPSQYQQRLRFECEKFPYWHDDGVDCLSYGFDLIKTYRFGVRPAPPGEIDPKLDRWERAFRKSNERKNNWMIT